MTTREDAVDRTNVAIGHMYQALAGLSERRVKLGKGYEILGEGIVETIFKLRKEIDDMIGLADYIAVYGVPLTDAELANPPAMPSANGSLAEHHPAAT